jgi:hypothetical protein
MKKDLLDQIRKEFFVGYTTVEVKLGGRAWSLKTLNDGEEVWRDSFTKAEGTVSFVTARRAPTVAVALTAIDGISVRDIFLDDVEKETPEVSVLQALGFASATERFLVARRVYGFLTELPPEVIDALYSEYLVLEAQRRDTVNELVKKT